MLTKSRLFSDSIEVKSSAFPLHRLVTSYSVLALLDPWRCMMLPQTTLYYYDCWLILSPGERDVDLKLCLLVQMGGEWHSLVLQNSLSVLLTLKVLMRYVLSQVIYLLCLCHKIDLPLSIIPSFHNDLFS